MANVHRSGFNKTSALLLGSAFLGVLGGCQIADSGAPTRSAALALVTEALGKVRAVESDTSALGASVSGLSAKTGLAELQDALGTQKQALFGMESALQSYGGRVEDLLACGCDGALDDFRGSVQREISGLPTVDAALSAVRASVAGLHEGASPAAPQPFVRKLPTGKELTGAQGGIESALVALLEDDSRLVDKTTWFDFDQLTFQLAKTELDMAKSKPQLDNIAAILTAYPKLTLKIGGYTDNSGPAQANKKLSLGRAEAVKSALIADGIAAARLEAEGYGPEFPICAANDSEDCKALNRRVAVRVTAK